MGNGRERVTDSLPRIDMAKERLKERNQMPRTIGVTGLIKLHVEGASGDPLHVLQHTVFGNGCKSCCSQSH